MIRNIPRFIVLMSALNLISGACEVRAAEKTTKNVPVTGMTPEQISERWWQWALSAPDDQHPLKDVQGVHCAVGQKGSVWFLAGGFGSSRIARTCTVPHGKKIFFPIINFAHYRPRGTDALTCERAKELSALKNDSAIDLFAVLDDTPIDNLRERRIRSSSCFNVFEGVPGAYDAYPSASDGFWVLLEPLAKGRHTLSFGGRYSNGGMLQDIAYTLIVE